MENADKRLEYQMDFTDKKHTQIKQFNKEKHQEEINMCADLGLLSIKRGSISKLKSTQVRKAINAANRISKINNYDAGSLSNTRQNVTNLPKLPNFDGNTGSLSTTFAKSSSQPRLGFGSSSKHIIKAFDYAENNLVFDRINQDDESTEDDSTVKTKRFLEIDRFIKKYRKSNQKCKKFPSFQDVQMEIKQLEQKRNDIRNKRYASIPLELPKSSSKHERDEVSNEAEVDKKFTFHQTALKDRGNKSDRLLSIHSRSVSQFDVVKYPMSVRVSKCIKETPKWAKKHTLLDKINGKGSQSFLNRVGQPTKVHHRHVASLDINLAENEVPTIDLKMLTNLKKSKKNGKKLAPIQTRRMRFKTEVTSPDHES